MPYGFRPDKSELAEKAQALYNEGCPVKRILKTLNTSYGTLQDLGIIGYAKDETSRKIRRTLISEGLPESAIRKAVIKYNKNKEKPHWCDYCGIILRELGK